MQRCARSKSYDRQTPRRQEEILLLLKSLTIMGLGLAFCVGALPSAAATESTRTNLVEMSRATIAPSGFTGRRNSRAGPAQQQSGPQAQGQPDTQAQGQQNQPAPPQSLTLPAGTVVRLRIDEWLSTDRNVIGDNFSAVLEQPIVVNGWVVARRGQSETGRVSIVKKGGHGNGPSAVGSRITRVDLGRRAARCLFKRSCSRPLPAPPTGVTRRSGRHNNWHKEP